MQSRSQETYKNLNEKTTHAEEIMQQFLYDGGVLSGVVTDGPYARSDRLTGPSENNCIWTAYYLMSCCYEWQVSHNDAAKERAKKSYQALLKLHRTTACEGLIARSIRPVTALTDANMQLDSFFARGRKNLVHQKRGDAYALATGTSKGQMEGWLHGLFVYSNTIADDGEKKEIQAAVRNVVGSYVRNHYQILDLDGKPTKEGSHRPSFRDMIDRGSYIRRLAILQRVYLLTGDAAFEEELKRVESCWVVGRIASILNWPKELYLRHSRQNYPSYHLEALAWEALMVCEKMGEKRFRLHHLADEFASWAQEVGLVPFASNPARPSAKQQLLGMEVNKKIDCICAKPTFEKGNIQDTSRTGEEFLWRCNPNGRLVYDPHSKHSQPGQMEFSPCDYLYAYWKMRLDEVLPK